MAKCVFSGIIFSHQWKNVSYLQLAGSGIGNADLNTLAATIDTAWGTRFKSLVTSDCALTGVTLTYVPSVGTEIVGSNSTGQTGTNAGVTVDNSSSSFVANWNVNKYYRGGHPRWYVPGVYQAAVLTGGTISTSVRTNWATALNGFLNDVNAATTTNITLTQLGTLSFQHNNAWRSPPQFWPYASGSLSSFLGTQRRRIRS